MVNVWYIVSLLMDLFQNHCQTPEVMDNAEPYLYCIYVIHTYLGLCLMYKSGTERG